MLSVLISVPHCVYVELSGAEKNGLIHSCDYKQVLKMNVTKWNNCPIWPEPVTCFATDMQCVRCELWSFGSFMVSGRKAVNIDSWRFPGTLREPISPMLRLSVGDMTHVRNCQTQIQSQRRPWSTLVPWNHCAFQQIAENGDKGSIKFTQRFDERVFSPRFC